MAKGYWVVNGVITDREVYATYDMFVGPFLAANNGKVLVASEELQAVEGTVMPRVVVVEFPSYAAATAAYYSEEYARGKKLRLGVAVANFAIVEGVDG